jgi:hypothetical protein
MKPEKWFWKNRIKPVLDMAGVEYDRIESNTSVSVPDIAVSGRSGHGWIEMKVAKVGETYFQLPTMTMGQVAWLQSRGNLCDLVYVLAWEPDRDFIWMFDHNYLKELKDGVEPEVAYKMAIMTAPGPMKNTWSRLINNIFNEFNSNN